MICNRLDRYRTGFLLALNFVAGCVSTPTTQYAAEQGSDKADSTEKPPPIVVTRSARYTLIEMRPDPSQKNLQEQVINLRIPATASTTVGDAMRYVLRRSGYRLCDGDSGLSNLLSLTLPAAHLQLGPLPLNQTLQLLAGNAWRLLVDEYTRQVCFIPVRPETEVQP